MKTLVAIVSFAASFAMANGNTTINWPSINGLSINNACATEETFKSLKPVKVCTDTKTKRYAVSYQGEAGEVRRELKNGESPRRGEWLEEVPYCVAWGKQDMEVSRTYTYSECADAPKHGEGWDGSCSKFVTKSKKAGLTYNVEKITHWGEADEQTFFKFRVPMCK